MSDIVILQGSPRKGGNTEILVNAFAEGAREHNTVKIISVREYKVHPCIGCNACFNREGNACAQQDDMQKIYPELARADILVIATPVYFYGPGAQIKAVIDRLHTPLRDTFKIKRTGLLCVAAATIPGLFDAIRAEYRLAMNFFHLESIGEICVPGVKDKGDILGNSALDTARKLGSDVR